MSQFNKIAVVSRLPKDRHTKDCQEVIEILLEKHNLDVYLNESFAKQINYSKSVKMEKIKDFDLVVVLGGDGTILWAARYSNEVPLFGINAGHLGFLTTATLEDKELCIDRIMKGDLVLERCMRLKVTLNGKELPTALNESYATNKLSAHICHLNISVNSFDLGQHLLDGLMVSTPVGSTAYALSAGGSILEPRIKAMQIVPVNSVSRRIRPFVVPGEAEITITVPEPFEDEVVIINDGLLEGKFKKDSILEITQAPNETVFVRFPDYGFFNRLQDKLDF
ncbi:MAG: NAD(+)/NADH kinase [Asgard group archaeon]|nr:NAD(+)/NADH kinase [Asgard group archaeon]